MTGHKERREAGHWMSARELELHVAHGYALHSQTVQALAQRLDANLQTARALREQGTAPGSLMAYPNKTPDRPTAIWKDMAIRMKGGRPLPESNGDIPAQPAGEHSGRLLVAPAQPAQC